MAKTDYVYLKGKVKWFRASKPDDWGNWKTDLYLVPESLEKVRELQTASSGVSGIKNTLKKDEEGYFITLRRPTAKTIRGKLVGFTPPEVLDGTKTLPDGTNPPLGEVAVGNGSDVTIKLSVYQHGTPGGGKAKACRWEAARIDNLVPYEGKSDFTEGEKEQIEGLSEQPAPLF